MFDSSIETTIISTGIALWLAHGWYLNERLKSVHSKLDSLLDQFNGLRDYLYEIDPQFDDERNARVRFEEHMANPSSNDTFAGMSDMGLIRSKKEAGKRTLNSGFGSPL